MTVLNVGIQNLREMGQLVHQLRPWDRFPSAAVFSWSSAKVEGHLVIKVCKCFTDVFCYLSTNFHPILFSGFGCSHISPYKRITLYICLHVWWMKEGLLYVISFSGRDVFPPSPSEPSLALVPKDWRSVADYGPRDQLHQRFTQLYRLQHRSDHYRHYRGRFILSLLVKMVMRSGLLTNFHHFHLTSI